MLLTALAIGSETGSTAFSLLPGHLVPLLPQSKPPHALRGHWVFFMTGLISVNRFSVVLLPVTSMSSSEEGYSFTSGWYPSRRRTMPRCWLALLAVALLLCAPISYCRDDARKGDPDDLPAADEAVNNTEGHLGEQKVVQDSVEVGDGKNSKDEIRAEPEKKDVGELQDDKAGGSTEALKEDKEASVDSSRSKTMGTKDNNAAHIEECDAQNKCVDEKNKFVACLRVPGNDSPTLSLLIQNKGTGSLNVNIVAPNYVSLEQNVVLLQAEEDRKVKVTVEYGVNNTPLLLIAGDGRCNLSFWDMIPVSIREAEGYSIPSHINFFIRSTFIYLVFAAFVLLGAAWLWVRFQRMHQLIDPRYSKLDAGLPVSSGGSMEDDVAGWDNGWEGSWDDEEAPKTPSKTLSNPSSKGLASRRSSKDGWRD